MASNKLLSKLIKGYENGSDPKVRARAGKLSGFVGIACNALLCAGKLIVGAISGSLSIMADAMNNLTDAASSVVTLAGFKLAEKPADEDHPYGHARFEYLSGLAVAALIIVIGFELGRTSVDKILAPTPVSVSLPLVLVLTGSIAVKLWLSLFNSRLGKHIQSSALQATAADSRNDCISTGVVLAAAITEHFTDWRVDGWMGLAVALFILYSGAMVAKETISPLLGEAASPELQQLIVDTVRSDERVLGYHDLMVHDYGPGQRFASLHVEMDQRDDPLLCHEIIDNLERRCLREHNIHLVIHYDPVVTGDAVIDTLRTQVVRILHSLDTQLTIHDFRMVQGSGHTNLIFDVALPFAMKGREKEIRNLLETTLSQENGTTYYTVITFDLQAFNQ